MFIINQPNSNNQFIVNKNLLKHEQRINRKEEKAVVKLTWPMLLTFLRRPTRAEKSSQVTNFPAFFKSFESVFFRFVSVICAC